MKTFFVLVFLVLAGEVWGQAPRLVVPVGHTDLVSSVAFSPDGKYILTGSDDNTAKLWDVKTGREIQTFKGHSDEVNSVVFSPDGKYVLTGSWDKTAKLWDLNGHEIQAFTHKSALRVFYAIFSPNGKTIATVEEYGTIILWKLSGKEIRRFESQTDRNVAFSPDAKYILTGGKTGVTLNDITGKEIRSFEPAKSFTFSPDGKYILTTGQNKITQWDIMGKKIQTFEVDYEIESVAFSPDCKYVLIKQLQGLGSGFILYDLASRVIQVVPIYADVHSVTFSPDSKLLVARDGRGAMLWDITGKAIRQFNGHSQSITSMAFSPDGNSLVLGSTDNMARLWHLTDGWIQAFDFHEDWVTTVTFSPNGDRILTGSRDGTFKILDIDNNLKFDTTRYRSNKIKGYLYKKVAPDRMVASVAFSPDGQLVLIGTEKGLFRSKSYYTKKDALPIHSPIKCATFSPPTISEPRGGKYILAGLTYGFAKLLDASGKEIVEFTQPELETVLKPISPCST